MTLERRSFLASILAATKAVTSGLLAGATPSMETMIGKPPPDIREPPKPDIDKFIEFLRGKFFAGDPTYLHGDISSFSRELNVEARQDLIDVTCFNASPFSKAVAVDQGLHYDLRIELLSTDGSVHEFTLKGQGQGKSKLGICNEGHFVLTKDLPPRTAFILAPFGKVERGRLKYTQVLIPDNRLYVTTYQAHQYPGIR